MSFPTITLVSRPRCSGSWYARRWLVWQALPFQERPLPDTDATPTPLVIIDDTHIQGYDPAAYAAALYPDYG